MYYTMLYTMTRAQLLLLLTCFDLLECACFCAALEGRVATQQDVHHHTSRPDV